MNMHGSWKCTHVGVLKEAPPTGKKQETQLTWLVPRSTSRPGATLESAAAACPVVENHVTHELDVLVLQGPTVRTMDRYVICPKLDSDRPLTGRISYQSRAWSNGPWRGGLRAWSAGCGF
jgi:hypothetical protein